MLTETDFLRRLGANTFLELLLRLVSDGPGFTHRCHRRREGTTALIAVIGSDQIHDLGYLCVLIPATLGPMLLLLVAR